MDTTTLRKPGLITAAVSLLIAIGVPLAIAAPTATPPSDGQGYVDSTARCTKPDTAVIFGSTDTSRVAICQTAGGEYEYRGVRVSDGAKLIIAASQASDGSFVATNDGVTYTVTAKSLSVNVGGSTIRTETWTDFHGPQSPATSTSATTKSSTSASASPTTSSSAAPTTSGSASATPGATSTALQTSSAPASSAVPLPPPMPAEVGGSTSSTR